MELKELLILLQNEQMEYFDLFFEKTKKQVFYMIYSITKNHQVSEDLLQDTYLKFLRYKKNVKPDRNILAYLLEIAKTISYNYMKKHAKVALIDEENDLEIKDSSNFDEKTSGLISAIKEILNPIEFQIVILHVVNEMTHKQISEILKKPLGTITWTFTNAINKVRRKLANEAN